MTTRLRKPAAGWHGRAIVPMPTWEVTARRSVLVTTFRGKGMAQHRTRFSGAIYVLDGFSGRRYVPKPGTPDTRPRRGPDVIHFAHES